MAERRFGVRQKIAVVAGATQRIGSGGAHVVGTHRFEPLAHSAERFQRTCLGRIGQDVIARQAFGQPHGLAQPINNRELAVAQRRDDHVKTVGAKIYGSDDLRRLRILRSWRCGRLRPRRRNRSHT